MKRGRGGNVVTATIPAQTIDESSDVRVLSNNGSYLVTKFSPLKTHTVDWVLRYLKVSFKQF